MSATHDQNITINVSLDAAPLQPAGFGAQLHLGDQAAGVTLDGDRVRTYSSLDAVQTDVTASFLPAAVLAKATAVFSQRPKPVEFQVGRVDTGGGESYADGLAAVRAELDTAYGVSLDSRLDADILALATPIEALEKILVAQSDDADWLTSGVPAGLSALEGNERTVIVYHDEDSEPMAEGYLSNRLVFNPDTISAPWDAGVKGVSAYTTALTDAQRPFALANNANVGLPYDAETFFVDPGVNQNGRPIYEIVSADWFAIRLRELISTEKVNHSARGEKIPVSPVGQTKILALIDAQLALGVTAGHFVADQVEATAETITAGDLSAGRMRFTARAQLEVSARLFEFNINVSRNPLTGSES